MQKDFIDFDLKLETFSIWKCFKKHPENCNEKKELWVGKCTKKCILFKTKNTFEKDFFYANLDIDMSWNKTEKVQF